jgi:hypothetical protein
MKTAQRTLLGLCLLLVGSTMAHAQQPLPITNPPITPWLNLYRGGGSISNNYNTLVGPEFSMRSGIGQAQQQASTNQQAIADLQQAKGPVTTGHMAGFMTQRSYFQTIGTTGGGSTGGGFGTMTGR